MSTINIERDVERLVDALNLLSTDVKAAANLSRIDDTQFTRCTYIRAMFAMIEGNIHLMSTVIVSASNRGEIECLASLGF